MSRKFGVLLLLACASVANAGATAKGSAFFDSDKAQRLEALIQERMSSQRVPGVSLAIIDGGRVVYQRAFGYAGAIGQQPQVAMEVSTPSALGSLSKSFTAVAVMQLVDEGRVKLDDPIVQHLEELGHPQDPRIGAITIRQLLNHTSGFSTYDGNFGQADYLGGAEALPAAAQRLATCTLRDEPGASFEYSNGNYQLLGLLLERVDSELFEHVVQRRVLDRLGLKQSFVRTSPTPELVHAVGHRYWLTEPTAFDKPTPRAVVAQGGVYASAEDVARYLLDLLSEQPVLLSTKSRDLLSAGFEAEAGYGLGWFVEPHDSGQLIWHSGMNPGYEVEAGFLPSTDSGYVIITNANSGFVAGSLRSLIDGFKQTLLDGPVPADSAPSSGWWVVAALSLIAILLMVLTLLWLKRLFSGMPPGSRPLIGIVDQVRRVWVPVVLLAILAWLLWWYIPMQSGIPLPGLRAFAPDVGLLLLVAGGSALLLAVVRSATLLLRAR